MAAPHDGPNEQQWGRLGLGENLLAGCEVRERTLPLTDLAGIAGIEAEGRSAQLLIKLGYAGMSLKLRHQAIEGSATGEEPVHGLFVGSVTTGFESFGTARSMVINVDYTPKPEQTRIQRALRWLLSEYRPDAKTENAGPRASIRSIIYPPAP